jgi:hypothetical protein
MAGYQGLLNHLSAETTRGHSEIYKICIQDSNLNIARLIVVDFGRYKRK